MRLPKYEYDLLLVEVSTAHDRWESNGATGMATCHCKARYPIPEDADVEWFRSITCPRAQLLIEVFELEAGPL